MRFPVRNSSKSMPTAGMEYSVTTRFMMLLLSSFDFDFYHLCIFLNMQSELSVSASTLYSCRIVIYVQTIFQNREILSFLGSFRPAVLLPGSSILKVLKIQVGKLTLLTCLVLGIDRLDTRFWNTGSPKLRLCSN